MLGAVIYGILDNKLAIYYGASLTLLAVWIVVLTQRKIQVSKFSTLLIFFCAGLIIRGGYPSPTIRKLGLDPKEQAVAFLTENYDPNTLVGTGSPGVVWASKMKAANLTSTDVPTGRSPEAFLEWMKGQGIEVIYVDHDLYVPSPAIWRLIDPQIGLGLNRVFILEDGNFQVLEFAE
jgi:hypothetical protein